MRTTQLGLGTGIDTAASRYAFEEDTGFLGVEGKWHESWWVKTYLELGIVGTVLVALLFWKILAGGFRSHFRLRDAGLRVASGAMLAFLLWIVIYGLKGQYADLDPLNVYFWLFAGFLARIPTLDESAAAEPTAAEPR